VDAATDGNEDERVCDYDAKLNRRTTNEPRV